jgi:hypothetical protein
MAWLWRTALIYSQLSSDGLETAWQKIQFAVAFGITPIL